MTRREIALVGGLALVGLVGAFVATRQLAGLRAELALVRQIPSGEIARLRADNAQLRQGEKEREQASVSAPVALPASPPTELAVVSRADRMTALLAWAKIAVRGGAGVPFRLQQQSMASRPGMRAAGVSAPPASGPAFLVSSDHELPPRFGELFALRDDQVAQLQQALNVASAGLDERVAANTQVRDNGNGSYTLEVKEVPESVIAADRDRMIAAFRQVLGEEGYQAFALLNGESQSPNGVTRGGPAQFFNRFSTDARTATISKTASGYRYEMYHQGGRASGTMPTLADLKATVGSGIKLLPPGF